MVKCKSFWGHDYRRKTEDENGHKVSFDLCKKCGHRKNDRYEEYQSEEFEIYTLTAPFGILYGKTSGRISGSYEGFIFHSGSLSGSFSSELEEQYIVKYMDGNELKTKVFKAKDTSLVVDGKLCLENKFRVAYKKDDSGEWVERTRYGYKTDWGGGWIIHISELPDVEKMTQDYKEVR